MDIILFKRIRIKKILSIQYPLFSIIATCQIKTIMVSITSHSTKLLSLWYYQAIHLLVTLRINMTLQSPVLKVFNLPMSYPTQKKLILIPPLHHCNQKKILRLLDIQLIHKALYANWKATYMKFGTKNAGLFTKKWKHILATVALQSFFSKMINRVHAIVWLAYI